MSDIDIPNYQIQDYDLPNVRLGQGSGVSGGRIAGSRSPMYLITQGNLTHPLIFSLVLSSDHASPATGLALGGATPLVALSKNGGAFGAGAGAVSEIGNGWWAVSPNAADASALGPLILHATATGADIAESVIAVVGYNPDTPSQGGGSGPTLSQMQDALLRLPSSQVVSDGPPLVVTTTYYPPGTVLTGSDSVSGGGSGGGDGVMTEGLDGGTEITEGFGASGSSLPTPLFVAVTTYKDDNETVDFINYP